MAEKAKTAVAISNEAVAGVRCAGSKQAPCPESSLGRRVTKLRSPWPTYPPPDSGEIREIPPQFPAELPRLVRVDARIG